MPVPRSNGPASRTSAHLRQRDGQVGADLPLKNIKIETMVNNDTDIGNSEGHSNVLATGSVKEEGMEPRVCVAQVCKAIEDTTTVQLERDRKFLDRQEKRNQQKFKPVIERALGKAKVINAIDITDD